MPDLDPSAFGQPAAADDRRAAAVERPQPIREIDVRQLLQERREAILTLDGERYRLRITSNNRLILTK